MDFEISDIEGWRAPELKKTADWYVEAFGFEIIGDTVRDRGDRFIRCKTEGGVRFSISAARTEEEIFIGNCLSKAYR